MHAVERWFGPGFALLHPELQRLHREGGTLRGEAVLAYGPGWAGRWGRRMARRLGFSAQAQRIALQVDIHSDRDALYWDRRFGEGVAVRSMFRPVGAWPEGVWIESAGPLRLTLKVDIADGAWHWRPQAFWYRGLRLPLACAPRVDARKAFVGGCYAFRVAVSLPLLGLLFSYAGTLEAEYGSIRPAC